MALFTVTNNEGIPILNIIYLAIDDGCPPNPVHDTLVYHNGVGALPVNGTILYTDPSGTTPIANNIYSGTVTNGGTSFEVFGQTSGGVWTSLNPNCE